MTHKPGGGGKLIWLSLSSKSERSSFYPFILNSSSEWLLFSGWGLFPISKASSLTSDGEWPSVDIYSRLQTAILRCAIENFLVACSFPIWFRMSLRTRFFLWMKSSNGVLVLIRGGERTKLGIMRVYSPSFFINCTVLEIAMLRIRCLMATF